MAADGGEPGDISWVEATNEPSKTPAALERPPTENAAPGMRRGGIRDITVLVIGLLTALNLVQYKYFESTFNRNFALYNSIFLTFLTIFLAGGLLLLLFGVRRLFSTRPRKLTVFVLGVVLAAISIGGLLVMRQGSIPGLLLGLLALGSFMLIIAGQFEVGRKDAAGIFMAMLGMALVTLVPVHEAFGVFPFGDLWAAPNLAMMAGGAALTCAGILIVLGFGEPGGRPVASYALWLVGVMALFLVPFHEAAGINSNSAYGVVDQTLMVIGAITVVAGVALFVRKQWHDREFQRHLREGDRFYSHGDFGKALECYELALSLNPEYADGWAHKGSALERQDRLEAAQKSLERAVELDPENHQAISTLSAVYRRAGNPGKALALAAQATELSPESGVAWLSRANALVDLRRGDEALEAFGRALKVDPAYGKAWYNKGVLLLSMGRTEDALDCFEEVLGLSPGDERAMGMRALCYAALGVSKAEG